VCVCARCEFSPNFSWKTEQSVFILKRKKKL